MTRSRPGRRPSSETMAEVAAASPNGAAWVWKVAEPACGAADQDQVGAVGERREVGATTVFTPRASARARCPRPFRPRPPGARWCSTRRRGRAHRPGGTHHRRARQRQQRHAGRAGQSGLVELDHQRVREREAMPGAIDHHAEAGAVARGGVSSGACALIAAARRAVNDATDSTSSASCPACSASPAAAR